MTTETTIGTLEREDKHTTSELKLAEVQAETSSQDQQLPTWDELHAERAELGAGYRRWSDDLDDLRADLDAMRASGILNVHMPDGPESRRRRGVLAPLSNPYRELAPDKLDADHQGRKGGWTPKVPDGIHPPSILAERPDGPSRVGWLRRTARKVWNWDGSGA